MDAQPTKPLVIMTVKGKRGLLLKPLVWGPEPPPFVDESLLGLIARTAARNGFCSMKRVLRLADIKCTHIPALPSLSPKVMDHLAAVLKVDKLHVTSKMRPESKIIGHRHGYTNFHGVDIKSRYCENKIRRASPRSLAVSPYHRSMWDLRPFSFCVDSKETLLSACPICTRSLGWAATLGIAHCNFCTDDEGRARVDLRDFPQPFVSVADEGALSLLCDIVHPHLERRDQARRNLSPAFSNVSAGEMLDIIVAISCIITADSAVMGCSMRKFGSLEGFSRLNPNVMARASRTFMNWPEAFLDLADEMRAGAEKRVRHSGILKEMGSLSLLAWNPDLSDEIKLIFTQGNAAFVSRLEFGIAGKAKLRLGLIPDGYIPQKEAARRLKMRATDLKPLIGRTDVTTLRMDVTERAPILFRADEIAEIERARSEIIRQSTAALHLGIPLWAVEELCRRGRLVVETGPASVLSYGKVMVQDFSLRALITAMQQNILPRVASDLKETTLATAVARRACLNMPWPDLFEAVLDGRLTLRSTGKVRRGGFTANAALVDAAQLEELMQDTSAPDEIVGSSRMTDQEASIALGTQMNAISKIVAAGLLGSSGETSRRITGSDIAAFKAVYAFTTEVALRMGTRARLVRNILERLGIRPVFEAEGGKYLVWLREDIP